MLLFISSLYFQHLFLIHTLTVMHGRSPPMHKTAAGQAPKELSFGSKSEERTANHALIGTDQVGHSNAYVPACCRACTSSGSTNATSVPCQSSPWGPVSWGSHKVHQVSTGELQLPSSCLLLTCIVATSSSSIIKLQLNNSESIQSLFRLSIVCCWAGDDCLQQHTVLSNALIKYSC